jgi:hypothetical protein
MIAAAVGDGDTMVRLEPVEDYDVSRWIPLGPLTASCNLLQA